MAQLPAGQFDPSEYQDMRDFTPIPPGKYIAKVMSSEMMDTSTGGEMLILNFEIVAGKYTGKSFVTRLNLTNDNPKAVKMANEELATLIRACNLGPILDSDLLHNIAVVVTLKLEPGDGRYGPSNSAVNYATAQGLTEAPVNPEPDEAILAIINGAVAGQENKTPPTTKAPQAPAGFNAAPQQAPNTPQTPVTIPPAPAVPQINPLVPSQDQQAPSVNEQVPSAPPW